MFTRSPDFNISTKQRKLKEVPRSKRKGLRIIHHFICTTALFPFLGNESLLQFPLMSQHRQQTHRRSTGPGRGHGFRLRAGVQTEHCPGPLRSRQPRSYFSVIPRRVTRQRASQRATQTEVAERVAGSAALDCTEGRRPVQEALVLLR